MTPPPWTYPPDLLAALADLGLRPTPQTPPTLVREAVNDLYRMALRRLRDRRRAGEVPAAGYFDAVVALRKKYWMLTIQEEGWRRICDPDH